MYLLYVYTVSSTYIARLSARVCVCVYNDDVKPDPMKRFPCFYRTTAHDQYIYIYIYTYIRECV